MGSTRDSKAVAAERQEIIRQAVAHMEGSDRSVLLRQIARMDLRDDLRVPEALLTQLRTAAPNTPEFYGCWSVARSLLRVAQGASRAERIARLSLAHVYGGGTTARLLKGEPAVNVLRNLR